MATYTSNYNLEKPDYNDSADIGVINDNMDKIDAKMKEIEDAGGGGASTWAEVGNKPFETIGSGLNVDESGTLNATGGGSGGSSVEWNQLQTIGTKIAEVTIDGNKKDVYAPTGSGSGSIVAKINDFMFLQNSGIKTNILVGENDKIEVEFDYVDYNNDECVFATNKSAAGSETIHLTLYSNKYYSGNGSSEFSFGSATTGKHIYIFNDENNNCLFDGEIVNSNFSISNVGYYYLLGSRGTTSKNVYNGKIYRFKVTDKSTGNVKADLIPITYEDKIIVVDSQQYEKKKSVLFDKISGDEYYIADWYSGND